MVAIVLHTTTFRSRSFLRQTEEEIRAYILEITPVSMNMDEARSMIEQHFQIYEWAYGFGRGRAFVDFENGIQRRGNPRAQANRPPPIGVQSIQVEIGRYRRSGRLLASTFVFAGWGFGENAALVDVYVSKSSPAM